MTKIGLKLWNINTDYYLTCAKELYNQKVFDYIELYIVPDNLNKINKWKELNIPFDIHAPHFAHKMNLSKKELRQKNMEKYEEVKLFADELNANAIIFHGGSGGDYKETAFQLKNFSDKRILIENKPYKTLPFVNEPYYVGAKFEEIKYIIDDTGCGFCLDIGHAICAANYFKINPYEYIEKFMTLNPKRIHLSDIHIDTLMDEHLHLGDANLNFEKLFKIINKNIPITIETKKDSKENLDDFKTDSEKLRSML